MIMEIKETDLFKYKIEKNQVILTEYKEDDLIVEIPQTIEGYPVTELGAYLLSGKKCEKVIIPKGVKKIGRYGFYNSRNLQELCFTSDFMDLGSGAFTGCHNIRRIQIEMYSEISNLKEILAEIYEELYLKMTGVQEAVLWFPEYYEEGVENTPARILMTQIHGSGLYYRNCFQGKQFNFLEYDRRFEMAKAQESLRFLAELVYGRLSKPYHLTEEAKKQYESFLMEHYTEIAKMMLEEKREEEFSWMIRKYPLPEERKEAHKEILDKALEQQIPTMISLLMEDGRRFQKKKRRSFDL